MRCRNFLEEGKPQIIEEDVFHENQAAKFFESTLIRRHLLSVTRKSGEEGVEARTTGRFYEYKFNFSG
jgi:hypothetical protein